MEPVPERSLFAKRAHRFVGKPQSRGYFGIE
jgi:hypothetical protein